jgi:hypothetical protein
VFLAAERLGSKLPTSGDTANPGSLYRYLPGRFSGIACLEVKIPGPVLPEK